MTPRERFDFCDKSFTAGWVTVKYDELDLVAPRREVCDEHGRVTLPGTRTAAILEKLRRQLWQVQWAVHTVTETYFDQYNEDNPIKKPEDADPFLPAAFSPAFGLRIRNGRQDWLYYRYCERRAMKGGQQFARGIDVAGRSMRMREMGPNMAHNATLSGVRAAIQDLDPGTRKILETKDTPKLIGLQLPLDKSGPQLPLDEKS